MATKNRRTLELRLGKLGLILFVSGMSLLLFSMFLFGVLVGKHLDAYPDKYSGGFVDMVRERFSGLALATQQENVPSADELAIDGSSASGKDDFDLTFYKVLGDKRNNNSEVAGGSSAGTRKSAKIGAAAATVENDSPSGIAAVVPVPENAALANPSPGKPASGKEASKTVLPDQKKTHIEPAAPESSSSSSVDKPVRKGGFQVQAAAYKDVRQAEKMAKRLKSLGYAPIVAPSDIPNKGRWFRVIVGDFENRKKAQIAATAIAGKIKGIKCVIRRKSGNGV